MLRKDAFRAASLAEEKPLFVYIVGILALNIILVYLRVKEIKVELVLVVGISVVAYTVYSRGLFRD